MTPPPSREEQHADRQALLGRARWLAAFTLGYNLIEGLVSLWFGASDETLALLGFGLDSFAEVISGLGIWHMVTRLRRAEDETFDHFERRALKTTAVAFFLLTAGLALGAVLNLTRGHQPQTTFWGMIIALVSILTMGLLIRAKVKVGNALHSAAILADAACTRTCFLLSLVLLAASAGYTLTGIGGLDAMGALGIAALSWHEGRESWEKARGKSCSCTTCPLPEDDHV